MRPHLSNQCYLGDWVRRGTDGVIVVTGAVAARAVEAVDILATRFDLKVGVLNMASIKPLDREAILDGATTRLIVTLEDHNVTTGLGQLVGNVLAEVETAQLEGEVRDREEALELARRLVRGLRPDGGEGEGEPGDSDPRDPSGRGGDG